MRGRLEGSRFVEQRLEDVLALFEHDPGRELGQVRVEPGDRPRRRIHQDERVDPLGCRQHDAPRDHPAHRVPEQPKGVDVNGVCDAQHVGGHPVERVGGRVVRLVARAVAAVVEGDHSVSRRQRVDVVREVLLRPAEPVDEQQPRSAPGVGDLESHTVVHGHAHADSPPERRVRRPPTSVGAGRMRL